MEEWFKEVLDREGVRNVEVKKIGNNYYAYSVSSVYDKGKKRPR